MFCPLKGLSRETNMLTGERIGVLVPLPTPSALMGNGGAGMLASSEPLGDDVDLVWVRSAEMFSLRDGRAARARRSSISCARRYRVWIMAVSFCEKSSILKSCGCCSMKLLRI